ncbi:cytochrome c oxidase accessory protein CcoG [Bordetella sp. LUAb4]|uniref:cytochrome c oxidase accessory protein CcoG n=1 Tax=Bordetella sp. LUAb4 TaxID=2843195 RepID=UPI001E4C5274|nr:cytochrome c oxidase accessory protein CcoG [Bordetella sp. LUAb4]
MNEGASPATATPDGNPRPPVEHVLLDLRGKIQPRSVRGRYASWRVAMVLFTQAIFYGLPWLNWNGRQALLFDLSARKFHIFWLTLWPQDIVYLAALLIISALSLFLFTALAGRLFCGYACPQTVYTEIFMWIERQVEGDRQARLRLDKAPWTARKTRLKVTKHAAWFAVAVWTGFTFIGYFAPIRDLGHALVTLQLSYWQGFWMLLFGFATWGNAGFLRESVCKYMCPYARFQSVMFDPDTLLVTYDQRRGDPRGGRSRQLDHRAAGLGDCVDCSLCVQVCPTGIDIRNGLQYMCIGCGACIDACSQVMKKMRYPAGLIRYTSETALRQAGGDADLGRHWRRALRRPRVLVYAAVIALLVIGLQLALAMRNPLRLDLIRDRGILAREVAGGLIENVYQLQLINTASRPLTLRLQASGLPDMTVEFVRGGAGEVAEIAAESNRLLPIRLRVPAGAASPGAHPVQVQAVEVEAASAAPIRARESTSFYIPE